MDTDSLRAKEAFQKMNFKEKVVYLIQIYGVKALIFIGVAVLVLDLVGRATWNRPADKVVGIGIHSEAIDQDLVDTLKEDITAKYPSFVEDGREFYVYWFYSGYSQDQAEQKNSTAQKLAGATAAGQVDVMVGDIESLEQDAKARYLMPLTELFSQEELEALNRAFSLTEEDEVIPGVMNLSFDIANDNGRTAERVRDVPYLLHIAGKEELLDNVLIYVDGYLGIVNGTENREETRSFIFALAGDIAE